MPSRVPDATGWWWRESGAGAGPYFANVRERSGRLTWSPKGTRGIREVEDDGRWLGPVAPPCPEGRVRVEMREEDAHNLLAWCVEMESATGWIGRVWRRIRDALLTALGKGAA